MAMVKLDEGTEKTVTLYEMLKDGYQANTLLARRIVTMMSQDGMRIRKFVWLVSTLYRAKRYNDALDNLVATNKIASEYDDHLVALQNA